MTLQVLYPKGRTTQRDTHARAVNPQPTTDGAGRGGSLSPGSLLVLALVDWVLMW
jgi:hypothetical protein